MNKLTFFILAALLLAPLASLHAADVANLTGENSKNAGQKPAANAQAPGQNMAGAAPVAALGAARAAEFHVATNGNDANRGTKTRAAAHIQRAADLAQPGDVITVHEGVYRERINPPRGGASDAEAHRLSGGAGREGRDQGLGGRQELGEGPGRCLEGDAAQFVLRRLQSLQRPHPRRLVRSPGPRASHRRGLSQRRLADRGGASWTKC